MPRYYVRETFFRPQEHVRECSTLPASLYNCLQLALKKSGRESLFIPIRSMQYQAVVEHEEIIFVDGQGGYAYQDGEGGRLIRIAWQLSPATKRDSLDGPMPCNMVYYCPGLKEIQWRLMSELPPALGQILRRQREKDVSTIEPRVIPLRRNT